jgi:hypothetical protein
MNEEILPLLTPEQRRSHMERWQKMLDLPDRPRQEPPR